MSPDDHKPSRHEDKSHDSRRGDGRRAREKDCSRSRKDDTREEDRKSSRGKSKEGSKDKDVEGKRGVHSKRSESAEVKTQPISSELDGLSNKDKRQKGSRKSSSGDQKKSPAISPKGRSPLSKGHNSPPSSSEDSSDSDSEETSPSKEVRKVVTKERKSSKVQPKTHSSGSSSSESDHSADDRDSKGRRKTDKFFQKTKSSATADSDDDGREKLGDTPEKAHAEKTMEEGEVEDDEEEKEEGEISEEEDDEAPAKPLIAMNEDMSDITSEDEAQALHKSAAETKQDKKDAVKSPHTPDSVEDDAPPKQSAETTAVDMSESSPPRKVERSNRDEESPRAKREGSSSSRKVLLSQMGDREDQRGEDRNEDNSQRERPVLESESEEEEGKNDRDGIRSHVEAKSRMGSSVSIVKPRDRAKEGDGSRDKRDRRMEDDRRDERSGRRDRDRRSDRGRYERDERDSRRRGRNEGGYDRRDDGRNARDGDTRRKDNTTERKPSPSKEKAPSGDAPAPTPAKKTVGDITTRTGGAYIPPAKLRMMQEQITDKTSVAYQRMSWEALKKSINGLINKVNVSNIINIIKELFQENIVRGRGLLARSVIQAQAASPTFTHVYAALVAIINTKFPQNGELILRRLILMFRRGYRRNDKALCLSSTRFIAHLVNQQVAHEVLALEILTLLLETPTDDSVEIAIGFLKECGQKLTEVSPRGINSIFERLRMVLHEGMLDKRVEYMVETMFAIRKDGFQDHQAVLSELDLVEEEEQFTHLLQVEDAVNGEEILNVFKEDKNFAESEEKYKALKKEILEEGSSDEGGSEEGSSGSETSESDEEAEERENAEKQKIIDQTETVLVALRRTIYLTIQSSLDHNECAHKMLKMELKPGQEVELCNMILDCCAQLRTYEKFFGLLAQRFCQIDKKYIEPFQQIFVEQYETIHRLETNKLRNVAKFFAHMLHTDAISWGVLSVVKLTEEDTTSASRIFLKILFQELSEYLGLLKLNQRLKDPTLSPFFEGIMPRDNPKNTRFSINFFTTIGLGGLTDDLREHLKNVTKKIVQDKQDQAQAELAQKKGGTPSSSSESSSDDSDSSSDSDDESGSSDSSDSSANRGKKKSLSKNKRHRDKNPVRSKSRKEDKHKKRSKEKSQQEDAQRKSSRDKENSKRRRSDKEKSKRNGKRLSPEKGISIAARLLSMAQYGDIAQAVEDVGPETRKDRRDTWRGEDRVKDRSIDERDRRRKDRSPEEEPDRRERQKKGEFRQRRDESEERNERRRGDQFRNERGRNEEEGIDRRKRYSDRDFNEGNNRERNDFRNGRGRDQEGREMENGFRGFARRDEQDFRARERPQSFDDNRRDRGRREEGRNRGGIDSLERGGRRDREERIDRDKAYPDERGDRNKAYPEERGDRGKGYPGGGVQERKRPRHDSSSESSGDDSSASDDSQSSDQGGKKEKAIKKVSKSAKPATAKRAATLDRKRQELATLSPPKRKRPRKDRPSASPSSTESSSEEEGKDRRKVAKGRGSPPSSNHKTDKRPVSAARRVTPSSRPTKKPSEQQSSKKRHHSVESSASESESESSDSESSDSSDEEPRSRKEEARPQKQRKRENDGKFDDRRQGRKELPRVDSSSGRGREERAKDVGSRRSRERKGRR